MKNLLIRTITGFFFTAAVVLSILFYGKGTVFFYLLFLFFTAVGTFELVRMARNANLVANLPLALLLSVTLFSIPPFVFILPKAYLPLLLTAGLVILLLLGVGVMVLELFRARPNPIGNVSVTLLPMLWVAVPFAIIGLLLGSGQVWLALSLFVIVWLSDTLAYCFGRMFGKHKLFERVSPKKTIEGFVLSLCFTTAIAAAFHWIPFLRVEAFTTPWHWAGFALTVVVFATLGDLVESLFKRSCSVKDSGNILPGHGGVLDRFDSALLAIPVASTYWLIFELVR